MVLKLEKEDILPHKLINLRLGLEENSIPILLIISTKEKISNIIGQQKLKITLVMLELLGRLLLLFNY